MAPPLSALSDGELAGRMPSGEGSREEQEGYRKLLAYRREQDLRAAPIVAEGLDGRGMKAQAFILPWVRFAQADLSAAVLCRTGLRSVRGVQALEGLTRARLHPVMAAARERAVIAAHWRDLPSFDLWEGTAPS